MNSPEEQHLTWNEPTTNESLVMIRNVFSQYSIDPGTGLFPHASTFSLFRYIIVRTTDQTNSVLENGSESGYIICDPIKILTETI